MFWMIAWTAVQVAVGLAALKFAIIDLSELIKTGFNMDSGPEGVAGVFGSLGLIGGPIWVAINVYPVQHWQWLGLTIAFFAAILSWGLIMLIAFAGWTTGAFFLALLSLLPKSVRRRKF